MIRAGLLVFAIFLNLYGQAFAAGSLVQSLQVDISLRPAVRELVGRAVARIASDSTDEAVFYLAARARVIKVSVNGEDTEFSAGRGRLTVSVPSGKGESLIEIQYACNFDDPLPSSFISHEDPSYGVMSVISNTGTFLDKGACWYPHPVSGAAQLTFMISAPHGVEAVTDGERIMHRSDAAGTVSGWFIRSPAAPVALSAGAYTVTERRHGNLWLYAYVTTINTDLAERYLTLAAQYLDYYQELFGPYPFPKFAIVENFLPTGYGYPSYTLIGSGLLRMNSTMFGTLAHEIAHCWWGNAVFPDYLQGNWSEGLATYLAEHLLAERRSLTEARIYRYRLISDYSALVTPDKEFTLREFISRTDPVSRSVGYSKGAMVFHMIRQRVGDSAFFSALRSLIRDRSDKKVAWNEVITAFEKASGVSLAASAKLWLDKTGGARLGVKGLEVKQNEEGWELRGTIMLDPPDYQSFVRLAIRTESAESFHTVAVTRKWNEFVIPVAGRPVVLTIDPHNDLFRVINHEELPATVNRIKGAEELTVITAAGRNYDEHLKLLIESLGKNDVTYMSEIDIGSKLPATDILFYGMPAAGIITDALPEGVSIRQKYFEVFGKRFSRPEDLLFVVYPNPADKSKIIAVCYPLSEYAAKSAVPKITHYGRSGYLVFSSGINKMMGEFQASLRGLEFKIAQPSAK